ncbi:MAG: N-6 DNA methylase [Pirellulaceae bacterium]|nr:N-6 DNA methylase [Pirellulaceae bacterium]
MSLHTETDRKNLGAYYTPHLVANSLVRWAAKRPSDRLLDPSCGDGAFLKCHRNAVGVELDPRAIAIAHSHAPHSRIHAEDFFSWVGKTRERFDCVVGNPPFIRYQRFSEDARKRALSFCAQMGSKISKLTSSWVPFIVAATSVLKREGRIAFVVPAEIGHAPYASPLIEHLSKSFSAVKILAIRKKLFPDLSEDAWLLFAEGFECGPTKNISLTKCDELIDLVAALRSPSRISLEQWKKFNCRLRPFILPSDALSFYTSLLERKRTMPLGEFAQVGIGYVTGANDFFHIRPSQARMLEIPEQFLVSAVRNSSCLAKGDIVKDRVKEWIQADSPFLLLRLGLKDPVPDVVRNYLNSRDGRLAQATYKCRTRTPWYVVPHVHVPDAFLSYMCGREAVLVANQARCVGTNSVHGVYLKEGASLDALTASWGNSVTRLSCELEGHPLGGGMLKLEPREAMRVQIPSPALKLTRAETRLLEDATTMMRKWRHYE